MSGAKWIENGSVFQVPLFHKQKKTSQLKRAKGRVVIST